MRTLLSTILIILLASTIWSADTVRVNKANIKAGRPLAFRQCQGKTKNGERCKAKATKNSLYCYQHKPKE
jgi:hypothetical protein